MVRLVRWFSGQNSHVVDLLHGASIAGVLKALGAILAFGLSVVLGRMLGAETAGVYFLAFTVATVAATIGRVGLDSALLRFVAAGASASNWYEVRAVYRTTMVLGLICSLLVATILYLGADFYADTVFSDPTLATPIRIMAVAVVPLSLGVLISRALQGLSRIRDSVLVFTVLPTGIALVGTGFLASEWGVNGAITAYLIAVTAALAYGWVVWRHTLANYLSLSRPVRVPSPMRKLLKSGAPLLIGAILQLVMQMSGTLMLGIWSDNADVSRFSVAARTATLISFVLLAVNTIAQPKFAELYARRDMESLAATAHKATILMTSFAAPVFLVFLIAPTFVMSAFGSDFVAGAAALTILSIGQFVNVIAGSVGILLVMSGHERDYRNVQIVSACLVLLLNVLLIPSHGAVGAAVAAASGLVTQNVLFGYYVWVRLGLIMFTSRSHGGHSVRDA
jgi:O-antigen/teichoic acid export membrane protein